MCTIHIEEAYFNFNKKNKINHDTSCHIGNQRISGLKNPTLVGLYIVRPP